MCATDNVCEIYNSSKNIGSVMSTMLKSELKRDRMRPEGVSSYQDTGACMSRTRQSLCKFRALFTPPRTKWPHVYFSSGMVPAYSQRTVPTADVVAAREKAERVLGVLCE